MKTAGLLVLLSAALHVVAVVAAGFAPGTLALLLPAVVYAVLSAGLARGMMSVAWLSFFVMFIGAAGALADAAGGSLVPAWATWSILVADLGAAAALFATLWKGRGASAA